MIPTTRKRQDDTKRCPNRNRTRERRKEKVKIKSKKAREKTAHKGNTQLWRLASSADGVYTESVTKESNEAKIKGKRRKAKKSIQETNGNDNTKRKGKTENGKKREEERPK